MAWSGVAARRAAPPCPWHADTEAEAKAHFGEAEVASWRGPPAVDYWDHFFTGD